MRALHHVRLFASLLMLLASCFVAGCGKTPPPPAPVDPPTALTLEDWKTIQAIEEKYDGATLERLRMSNPQLQNNRNWQAYMNQHVIPERKKDFPYAPGQQPP